MVYKTILLILLSITVSAQIMLNPKRSDILNPPVTGGGYNGYPTIVYHDTAIVTSDNDSIMFTHWSSTLANDLILLCAFTERSTATAQWNPASGDTVKEAGWTQIKESGMQTTGARLSIWWKVASGDESGDFYVESQGVGEQGGFYIVLRNVDVTAPIEDDGDTANVLLAGPPYENSITLDAATTVNDSCLALGFMSTYRDYYSYTDSIQVTGTGWSLYHQLSPRPAQGFTPSGFVVQKNMYAGASTDTVTIRFGNDGDNTVGATGYVIAIKGYEP